MEKASVCRSFCAFREYKQRIKSAHYRMEIPSVCEENESRYWKTKWCFLYEGQKSTWLIFLNCLTLGALSYRLVSVPSPCSPAGASSIMAPLALLLLSLTARPA